VWVLERGDVCYRTCVEDDDVRDTPGAKAAAVLEAEPCSRESGHPVYRGFQREYALVASVVAEHPRECAVVSRVRHTVAQAREAAVAGDHGHGVRHDS